MSSSLANNTPNLAGRASEWILPWGLWGGALQRATERQQRGSAACGLTGVRQPLPAVSRQWVIPGTRVQMWTVLQRGRVWERERERERGRKRRERERGGEGIDRKRWHFIETVHRLKENRCLLRIGRSIAYESVTSLPELIWVWFLVHYDILGKQILLMAPSTDPPVVNPTAAILIWVFMCVLTKSTWILTFSGWTLSCFERAGELKAG